MAAGDEPEGEIVPLSWFLDHVQRFTHCRSCNSPDVLFLPPSFRAENVECEACKQTGFITFL
jgi:hypothetical protein